MNGGNPSSSGPFAKFAHAENYGIGSGLPATLSMAFNGAGGQALVTVGVEFQNDTAGNNLGWVLQLDGAGNNIMPTGHTTDQNANNMFVSSINSNRAMPFSKTFLLTIPSGSHTLVLTIQVPFGGGTPYFVGASIQMLYN